MNFAESDQSPTCLTARLPLTI